MVEYLTDSNEIVISKGDYIRLCESDTMQYYKYIGKVDALKNVPTSNCLYVMDGLLYIRKVDLNRLNKVKNIKTEVKKQDDSGELDLEIKPGDNSTLIIVKELLKGFTKNSFRALFDDDSDFNNMRRAIEKCDNGKLSLDRFEIILKKLGLKYKMIIFSNDDDTITKFEDKLEKINSDDFGNKPIVSENTDLSKEEEDGSIE